MERDIQFGALRIFAAVADSETLTSAASKLGVTQSAVSQAISQLEALTKADLVVRRSKPIRLTPAGQVMKRHADEILDSARRMIKDIAQTSSGDLPKLNIGCVVSFSDVAGQQLMQRIAPIAAQISLQTGLTMPLSDALLGRNLDVLISSDPLQEHPELECHPLLRDPFILLVSETHCKNEPPTLEELDHHVPFVRYAKQTRLGMLTDLVLRRASIGPTARYELDNTITLIKTVKSVEGWAIATSLCALQEPALLEGTRALPLMNSGSSRYLSLLARKDELGETPSAIATICREICSEDVLPRVLRMMPWLEGQAIVISEAPLIWSG